MHSTTTRRTLVAAAAFGLLFAACGDDNDTGSAGATTTAAADGSAGDGGGASSELCDLAQEMADQDDFPTPEQLQQYQELAPEEIQDAVQTAAGPLIDAGGDPVAMFAAIGQDDVETASAEINEFETAECGIDHEGDSTPPNDQPEDGAAVVELTSTEYAFNDLPDTVDAGLTSFVLTNDGAEAHFMEIIKVVEGHTIDEALQFEGDPEAEGLIETVATSAIAAPGGDVEAASAELEPGEYSMLCFVPGPDGTPHAFMGMHTEFTVG
jgi:hypothetical protein